MLQRLHNYEVLQAHQGLRLDAFLTCLSFPGLSRSRIQGLIKTGYVHLASPLSLSCVDPSQKVRLGQIYRLSIPKPTPLELEPKSISFGIVFEDTDLLVIDKPAGLVVHPAPGHFDDTLVHGLLKHCQGSLSGIGGVMRPGIVHRLDKDTSGLMVVAKNDLAHQGLTAQFKQASAKTLIRKYVAFVYGIPLPSLGTIDAPIKRHLHRRQQMAVCSQGKPSKTFYEVKESWAKQNVAKLHLTLETGRTHQIRVHCSFKGFSLIGDQTYQAKRKSCFDTLRAFPRQALHAFQLSFVHPTSLSPVSFESDLPGDIKKLESWLNNPFNEIEGAENF